MLPGSTFLLLVTSDPEKQRNAGIAQPTVVHIQHSLKCLESGVPLQMCNSAEAQMQFIFLMIQHSLTNDAFWVLSNVSRHLFVPLWFLRPTRPEPLFTCNQCTIRSTLDSEVVKWPDSVMLWRLGDLYRH